VRSAGLAQTGPLGRGDCRFAARRRKTLRLCSGCPKAIGGYLERLVPGAPAGGARALLAGIAGGQARRGRGPPRNAMRNWDEAADALGRLAETGGRRCAPCSPTTTAPASGWVLTPERLVAAESRRTMTALALHGLRVDGDNRQPGGAADRALRWRGPAAPLGGAPAGPEQQEVLGGAERPVGETGTTPRRSAGSRCAARCRTPAAEPIGVTALVELADALYGDEEPLAGGGRAAAAVGPAHRRRGTDPDSEFELALAACPGWTARLRWS